MSKSIISVCLILLALFFFTGCATFKSIRLNPGKSASAPGQQKKAAGTQSAKPFAPGQKKK